MPRSYRSRFCRILTKYLADKKFNPDRTINEMRKEMQGLARLAGFPRKARAEKIRINNVSAEWIYGKDAREDRAVLYLHGGGYNLCSADTHRELAAYISIASDAKVLLPNYRLAPESPFPTAMEDAIMAYGWLLENGFSGGNIALAGDSAGGGLSIAASIALRDAGDPLPCSIACISPWTDLAMSGSSIKTHSKIDPMLNLQLLQIMASNYIGENDPRNPLISPVYGDLKGLPPIFIHVGSDEILLDDSRRIADKAKGSGVDVELKIYDRMWHVWHLIARVMPEARKAITELGLFIRRHYII